MAKSIKKSTDTSTSQASIYNQPFIDLYNGTGSTSTYSVTGLGAQGSTNSIWTTSTSPWDYNVKTADTTVDLGHHGINVKEGADIKIGNTSLGDFIRNVEQRLALLTPNPALEKEWEELKELGDRYRELEQHIKDKMKTWDILKREDNSSK